MNYIICPICHAHLDWCEKCDCESESRKKIFDNLCCEEECGQLSFDPYALSLLGQEVIE